MDDRRGARGSFRNAHRRRGRVFGAADEPGITEEQAEEMAGTTLDLAIDGDPEDLRTWLAVTAALYAAIGGLHERISGLMQTHSPQELGPELERMWAEPMEINRDEELPGGVVETMRLTLEIVADLAGRIDARRGT